MMTPGQPAGPASVINLPDLLDIVRNESVYSKRLAELVEQTNSATKAAEKLTKAKDLDQAITEAKRAENKAKTILAEEKKRADEVIANANQVAESIVKTAEQEKKIVLEEVYAIRSEVEELKEELAKTKHELMNVELKRDKAQSDLRVAEDQFEHLKEQIRKKQSSFAALLSD